MKRNITSLLVLISMLIGLASSAAAAPLSTVDSMQQAQADAPQKQVVRVYYQSQDDLNTLASHYDILQVDKQQGFAYVFITSDEYNSLQQAGYRLEADVAKTKLLTQSHEALPGQSPDTIPGFPCYRTVEETYTDMQNIASAHPDMAQMFDIGDSWTRIHLGNPNGYDILALRLSNENFGNMANKPTFFLMAEIHAREYVTAEAAMRYAELLINSYGTDPDITWLLDYFKIYIVTMTNPDGRKKAETGLMWRKNVDSDDGCTDPNSWGTDLNRNHSFKWNMGGSDSNPCGETYHGPTAGSEPEVQAIESYVRTLFPDQRGPGDTDPAPNTATGLFITLHSAAGLVLWPWGWTGAPAPNSIQLQTLGRHLAYFNYYTPQQSYQLYQTSGTSDEFAYGVLGVAGYTFEMGTDFFQDCGSFESTVYPNNRDALLYAFKTARRPYMNPAGPDSLNVAAAPGAANPGTLVHLTASANDTRYNNTNGTEPTQSIAEARYSIDSPSWITGTVTLPMTAIDGNFNTNIEGIEATIDTSGLTSGRHTIFVESKDANNNWGVTGSTFLYITEPGVSPVIDGYVRAGGTNLPLPATVTAGLFSATTDPATGYYSMTVISGTYNMVAQSSNYSPATVNGVQAQNHQTVQQDFSLYPYCNLFSDNVENGFNGWTHQNPWGIVTTRSHSPTHSWTDSPAGNYGNYANVSITSPVLNLSGYSGITVSFWHEYFTEANYDYGNVEVSTDGTHWTTLHSYTGTQNSWQQVTISAPQLDNAATGYLRFHFTSDSNTVYDGWYVDDIAIQGGGPGCIQLLSPTAEFTSNSPVQLGEPLNFSNQTTGTAPLTYLWNFGDGTGTSTDTNPSYTYAATGTYTVTLSATNPYGSSSVEHPVRVLPIRLTGVNLTQVTPGRIIPGKVVDFSADLSPDNAAKPYNYTIDYGDGTVIADVSSQDPLLLSHTYLNAGQYTILLSVQNAGMLLPITVSLQAQVYYQVFLPMSVK